MKYISGYKPDSKKFIVKDDKAGGRKLMSQNQIATMIKAGEDIKGISGYFWLVPVKEKKLNNGVEYTFKIFGNMWDYLYKHGVFSGKAVVAHLRIKESHFYVKQGDKEKEITSEIFTHYINYMNDFAMFLFHLSQDDNPDVKAITFAEKYGIVKYKVQGKKMIYNVSYPAYGGNPHYTIQHTVDLETMQETTKQLKRYDSSGAVNRR